MSKSTSLLQQEPCVLMCRMIFDGAVNVVSFARKWSSTCCASSAVRAFFRTIARCAQSAASSLERKVINLCEQLLAQRRRQIGR